MPTGVYIRTEQHRANLSKPRRKTEKQLKHLAYLHSLPRTERQRKTSASNFAIAAKKPRTEKQRLASIQSCSLTGSLPKSDRQRAWARSLGQSQVGDKNFNWKGGICRQLYPLSGLIRQSVGYSTWRKKVLYRDEYRCTACFRSNLELEVHHIKAFSIIFWEFINKYSQFSPIEDREIMLRLSVSHEDFWDIQNGRTLCCECHKEITLAERKKDATRT